MAGLGEENLDAAKRTRRISLRGLGQNQGASRNQNS
jgi:hypothetical protein